MTLTLLSSQSPTYGDSSIDFTSGIDGTYDAYEFHFLEMRITNNGWNFGFQVNAVGNTSFAEVATNGVTEIGADSNSAYGYYFYHYQIDSAQSTGLVTLGRNLGVSSGEGFSGVLRLYEPSSTTHVKHFEFEICSYMSVDYASAYIGGGYFNTTSAIDEVRFKANVYNLASGRIRMYGIS